MSIGKLLNIETVENKNVIINGDFLISQRGTSFADLTTDQYTIDMWKFGMSSDGVVRITQESTGSPTIAESGVYTPNNLKVTVTTADTSISASQYCTISTRIEGYNLSSFGFGQSGSRYCTLSFWIKATKTGTYCVSFKNSSDTRYYIAEFTVNSSSTWEKKVITIPIDTTGSWEYTNGVGLKIIFVLACGSNYQSSSGSWNNGNYMATSNQVNNLDSTSNRIYLAQIKLELGSTATTFQPSEYNDSLRLCQRYYQQLTLAARGYCQEATYSTGGSISWVPMRVIPTWSRISGPTDKRNLYASAPYGILQVYNVAQGRYFVQAAAAGDTYAYQVVFESTNTEL